MENKTSLNPSLVQAMETWLDLDNPDTETVDGLLGEAESCATVAFETMNSEAVEQTIGWMEAYVQKEDRRITNQLCDAANRDWSVSPEGIQQVRAVISAMLVTLKTLQAVSK